MELAIIAWVLCAFVAGLIARDRDADVGKWAVIGMLLGPIGIIWAYFNAGRHQATPSGTYDYSGVTAKHVILLVLFAVGVALFALAAQAGS